MLECFVLNTNMGGKGPDGGGGLAWATHQWKVVWVNPQDAQVRVVSVVPGNLFQDLQELISI